MVKTYDLILNIDHDGGYDLNMVELARECVGDLNVLDKLFIPKIFKKIIVKGFLLNAVKKYYQEFQSAGLGLIDINNPLHIIAVLHPDRKVRITALKLSLMLDINITDICNFKCKYCYQNSRDGNLISFEKEKIQLEDYKKIIKEASLYGCTKIKFTGGEPFLYKYFFDILKYTNENTDIQKIIIATNLSLIKGDNLKKLIRIFGKGQKLHIHTSIDGFNIDESYNGNNKIFTKTDFEDFINLSKYIFPKAGFSVNTVWTKEILNNNAYINMYKYMQSIRPKIWSISFPYIVKDVIDCINNDSKFFPNFQQVVDISKELLELNNKASEPINIAIPLVYKNTTNLLLNEKCTTSQINHPCFPCHGSYFIIDSNGNIFDCLLNNKSTFKYNGQPIGYVLKEAGKNSEWYNIEYKEIIKTCKGCRYINICSGQCVNDKINGNNGILGCDKTASSLLNLSETNIAISNSQLNQYFEKNVDSNGFYPKAFESINAILNSNN